MMLRSDFRRSLWDLTGIAPTEAGPIVRTHARDARYKWLNELPLFQGVEATGVEHDRRSAFAGAIEVYPTSIDID